MKKITNLKELQFFRDHVYIELDHEKVEKHQSFLYFSNISKERKNCKLYDFELNIAVRRANPKNNYNYILVITSNANYDFNDGKLIKKCNNTKKYGFKCLNKAVDAALKLIDEQDVLQEMLAYTE